jgi:uncharacterized protein (DUF3820 family)
MKQDRYMKFPWGKYRGIYLKDVPSEYLIWCLQNYVNEEGMLQVLADELMFRAFKEKIVDDAEKSIQQQKIQRMLAGLKNVVKKNT